MENYSVLMSVYAAEKPEHLRLSMESVFSQTLPTNDFVLLCDGPLTADLDRVLEEAYRAHPEVLRIIRMERNRGLGPTLNDGLPLCRNELIARMDSDDVALPDRCRLQVLAFEKEPELAIVGGAIDEFEHDPGNVVAHKAMPETQEEILRYARVRNPFNHPTVMYRKSVILTQGGYPCKNLHEDYALWGRLILAGVSCRNLPETLCKMRVDSGMYARRGGAKYLKQAIRLRWQFYREGLYTFWSFLYVSAGLAFVCLAPQPLRRAAYRRFLR